VVLPTDELLAEYLKSVSDRREADVLALLRPSCSRIPALAGTASICTVASTVMSGTRTPVATELGIQLGFIRRIGAGGNEQCALTGCRARSQAPPRHRSAHATRASLNAAPVPLWGRRLFRSAGTFGFSLGRARKHAAVTCSYVH
jgi:hypothetical protein